MRLFHAYSLSLVGLAAAQTNPYGQCGGQNWSGDTTCVSGWTCHYYNEWYSQCIPGSGDSGSSSTTTTSKPANTPTTTTSVSIPSGTNLPSVNGLHFNIDGKTSYFAGTNTYWIGFLTKNSDVDLVLDHMKASGLKILRVWGFNDVNSVPSSGTVYFQLHQNGQSTINTGPDGLQRLDYVVSAAASRGIKLIINFVNYWNDYGGIQAYINNYGGSKTSWYTDAKSQAAYKNYIKTVVNRYKGSSSVFAWELANEPRCAGCDTSVLYNWISSTSAYIKSLEPGRMVCIGDEGFGMATGSDGSYPYTYAEGLDFEKNLGISTIDFGTLHLYPSSWGTSTDWANPWISNHGKACAAAGKPCILEEYGMTSNHCSTEAPWQKTALSSNGIAADMFWQYGDTLSTGQSPNDGNTIYYGSSDYTCLVTNHVAGI